jgi:thiosulfate/3-mercaptopyruvate sulfurtransferase
VTAYVTTHWLQQHLGDPDLRVVEASVARASYDEAHVPGAAWADFHRDLLVNGDETSGEVITPAQFAALMNRLGITPNTTVVWYGDRHSSYAIRGFWTFDLYKHPGEFYVLESGRERWLAEGRPTESTEPNLTPVSYPVPMAWSDVNRATWREVRASIDAPAAVVLDVRSDDEYNGVSVRAKRGGHIPGAVHVEWTDVTDGDNVLKPAGELRAMYEAKGITPDKEVIAHCQLGIRAVHSWFVLKHVLGYPNVRNYDGSWQEWGNRDDLPIEK